MEHSCDVNREAPTQVQSSKQDYVELLLRQKQESCKHTMRRYSEFDCVMQACKKCGLVERLR